MKYFIFIILLFVLFIPIQAHSQSDIAGNIYKKIYCGDSSYLEIESDTFKEDVMVLCEKISEDQYGPIYNIEISKDNLAIIFPRKDIKFHLPISLLEKGVNNYSNLSLYFYDEYIKNWVSFSTEISNNELVGKVMHTGKITVYEKYFEKSQSDRFTYIAWIILAVGIIFVLIYNKYICTKKY